MSISADYNGIFWVIEFEVPLVFSIVAPIYEQSPISQPAQPERRIALVIGNGNYIGSTLANPENDARSMAEVLKQLE